LASYLAPDSMQGDSGISRLLRSPDLLGVKDAIFQLISLNSCCSGAGQSWPHPAASLLPWMSHQHLSDTATPDVDTCTVSWADERNGEDSTRGSKLRVSAPKQVNLCFTYHQPRADQWGLWCPIQQHSSRCRFLCYSSPIPLEHLQLYPLVL